MGEPIQRVSGSLRYFIVSEVQLSLSLVKCINNFFPNFCSFLAGNNISHKDPYIVLFGQERFAYLDYCNITAMTHSLNETSFTSAKRHPHFDERLTCLDNAPGTHFNR